MCSSPRVSRVAKCRHAPVGWLRPLFAVTLLGLAAAAHATITVDASTPPGAPAELRFAPGGKSPGGHVLAANSRFFTRDGRPWFPVMGEFHYARYPESEWETELRKIKAGGVTTIGTYVFWIFHEPQPGQFNWTGQRDLRKFVELCGRNGLLVWLRVGPWAHGEVRNGGFPDWVVAQGPVRQNAPAYLDSVRRFFGEIGRQVQGQFWKDGGPIVGVQLENEYHPAKDGEAHMNTLLEIARGAGLIAPFYTATGWDKAVIPAEPFLPIFGGYTEQFWNDSLTDLPPNQNFFFTTIRAEDNVGYLLQPKDRAYHERYLGYPFLTAEMGGGMAISYHRRPVMQAADSAAAALVKLGSGISLLGYYMYHGGTNPDNGGPVHESFTGWEAFNELETKAYDYQASIGEFGQVRDTYRATKALHLFLHDFGPQLAPMTAYFPAAMPRSLDDSITPRLAVRSDGEAAFIFINNHQRNHPLPDRLDFQVTVKLSRESVTLPSTPVTLHSGVYTHWTVNLPLGPARLSATAQLLCRLAEPDVYVFGETEGIPAEFVVALGNGAKVTAENARVDLRDGVAFVREVTPGRGPAFVVQAADGRRTTVLLLSRADTLNLWKFPLAGRERLVISPAALWQSGDGIEAEAATPVDIRVAVLPEGRAPAGCRSERTGLFTEYVNAAATEAPASLVAVRVVKTAAAVPSVRINPDPKRPVALQPTDADFARAAVWTLELPDDLVADPARARLLVTYQGDVARLYAGERLVTDNFYKGTPLEFGLWRLTPEERKAGLTLKVLPLRRDAPVFLPRAARPDFAGREQIVTLSPPEIVRDYSARFEFGP